MNDKEMIDCKICSHKEVCHYHECINDCEEWAKEYQCEYYQPKIPENAVIIDMDENPCMTCPVSEDIQRDVDCSTICGAVRSGIDWVNQCKALVKENKRLTKELAQARKETVGE